MSHSDVKITEKTLRALGAIDFDIDVVKRNGYLNTPFKDFKNFQPINFQSEPGINYPLFCEIIEAIHNATKFEGELVARTIFRKMSPFIGQRLVRSTSLNMYVGLDVIAEYNFVVSDKDERVSGVSYYEAKNGVTSLNIDDNSNSLSMLIIYEHNRLNNLNYMNAAFVHFPELIEVYYDEKGRPLNMRVTDKLSGKFQCESTYDYDDDDDVITTTVTSETQEVGSYVSAVRVNIKNNMSTCTLFDCDGNVDHKEFVYYDKNGRLISKYIQGDFDEDTITIYDRDRKGNVISIESLKFSPDNKKVF